MTSTMISQSLDYTVGKMVCIPESRTSRTSLALGV